MLFHLSLSPYPPASQKTCCGGLTFDKLSGSHLQGLVLSMKMTCRNISHEHSHTMRTNFENSNERRRIMLFTFYHWKLNKRWLKPWQELNLRGLGKNPGVVDRKTSASISTSTLEVWAELWAIYQSHYLCPEVSHRWWHCLLETGLSPLAFQRYAFGQADFPLPGRAPLGWLI